MDDVAKGQWVDVKQVPSKQRDVCFGEFMDWERLHVLEHALVL